ncbi:hypothetical protein I6E52_06395 [Salinibacterium sp. NG253]|uniref:hypothetical protein n=1 Tax=Salinibacterium sp. NG253 TaxID=2792039 RepID=UPI0018CF953E|nr:hypothetical protein [Salinibacterium sp. NG253]MBH0116473.1 hypothetical protein [Salinibacterium sp. NG253]
MTDETPHGSAPEEVPANASDNTANNDGHVPDAPPAPAAENALPATTGAPLPPAPPLPPVQPLAAEAAKSGLPGWAWALIIAGGLFVIGMIVTVVVVAVVIVGAANKEDCSLPGSCGQGLPPITAEEPIEELTEPASGERITLDGNANFGEPPVWGVTLDPEWEILVFDEDGINSLGDPTTGCNIVTSQRQTAVSTPTGGDLAASEAAMQEEVEALIVSGVSMQELDSGTVDIAVASESSGVSIEFLTSVRYQESSEGASRVSELLVRGMPASGSIMAALVVCETSVYEAGESPFNDLISGLAVTAGY